VDFRAAALRVLSRCTKGPRLAYVWVLHGRVQVCVISGCLDGIVEKHCYFARPLPTSDPPWFGASQHRFCHTSIPAFPVYYQLKLTWTFPVTRSWFAQRLFLLRLLVPLLHPSLFAQCDSSTGSVPGVPHTIPLPGRYSVGGCGFGVRIRTGPVERLFCATFSGILPTWRVP